MRLYRQNGYGTLGGLTLRGDSVRPDGDPGSNQPTQNRDGTQTFNGVTFDPRDERTFVLGAVAGLQFNNQTYGKCFFAMVDTVNFVDYFQRDLQRLFTEYDFYSLAVYDPVHFYGNIVAAYE